MTNLITPLLICASFFFLHTIPCLIKKYYETIDEENENLQKKPKFIGSLLLQIHNFSEFIGKESENKLSRKVLTKSFEIYMTLSLSFFSTLYFFKNKGEFIDYIKGLSNKQKFKISELSTFSDYWLYFSVIFTLAVTFIIIIDILNYLLNYTKYWFSGLIIVALIFISLICNFYIAPERECLLYINFTLIYLGSLIVNYTFICIFKAIITKFHSWLYTQDKRLDPAKLTLIWTIIVFILGLKFNLKK